MKCNNLDLPEILTLLNSSTNMFSGFKSLWHTPLEWQYSTASIIYLKYLFANYSWIPPKTGEAWQQDGLFSII